MPSFRRRTTIDRDIEKKILIGLIVSDSILKEISGHLDPKLFDLDFSKTIIRWINDYFSIYKEAPKSHIQDIYNQQKGKLKPSQQELIEDFLHTLSQQYLQEGQSFNDDYVLDRAREYLRQRSLLRLSDEIRALAETGATIEAEAALSRYGKISRDGLGTWARPLDDLRFMNRVFDADRSDELFSLKGKLGQLIGLLKRGWLFGVLGPMKRGKTFGMSDIAFEAVSNRLKTAFISLEMSEEQMAMRQYTGLGSYGPQDGAYLFPVFDCLKNKENVCDLPQRKCRVARPPGNYRSGTPYVPCSQCRINNPGEFAVDSWFVEESRPGATQARVRQKLKEMRLMFGRNLLRLKSFPAFSANIHDLMNSLDSLEFSDGFIPDVVVIDYADILAPEDPSKAPLDQVDETWKTLKRLSQERRCLVVTGSQGTRDSFDIRLIRERQTPGNIKKLAHVDLMITLNQQDHEKDRGVTRVGLLNHRHREFSKAKQALVLQQFELGQFHLDSEIIIDISEEYRKQRQSKADKGAKSGGSTKGSIKPDQ